MNRIYNTFKILKFNHIISIIAASIFFTACNTGIESTKKITPTRADRQLLQPAAEDSFIDTITPTPLKSWRPGKKFMITDSKASLLYEVQDAQGRRSHGDSLARYIVSFDCVESQSSPAGGSIGVIRFHHDSTGLVLKYPSRRDFNKMGSMTWSDMPMMIDLDMVEKFKRLLQNRKLWTRTALWYDENGNLIRGAKFIPVTVLDISPGNTAFPLTVTFSDGNRTAMIPMNMPDGKGSHGSRSFASLFSLTDPKERYPEILPEIWELICVGKVTPGMTKEEVKLSIGNPKEVDHGHNWDSLVDYWKYADGTYLLFVDDKLIDNRK